LCSEFITAIEERLNSAKVYSVDATKKGDGYIDEGSSKEIVALYRDLSKNIKTINDECRYLVRAKSALGREGWEKLASEKGIKLGEFGEMDDNSGQAMLNFIKMSSLSLMAYPNITSHSNAERLRNILMQTEETWTLKEKEEGGGAIRRPVFIMRLKKDKICGILCLKVISE
jgi:hypothetical protein